MWKLMYVSLTIAGLLVMVQSTDFGDYDSSFGTTTFDGDDRRQDDVPNSDGLQNNDGIQKTRSGLFSRLFDDHPSAGSAGGASTRNRNHQRGGESDDAKKEEDDSFQRKKGDSFTTPRNQPSDEDNLFRRNQGIRRNQEIRRNQGMRQAHPAPVDETAAHDNAAADADTNDAEADVDDDDPESEDEYAFIPPFGVLIGFG